MSRPSLDQLRAVHALKCIDALKGDANKTAVKYVGYVKALPASILTNGLGQALATELAAKDKDKDKDKDKAHDALAEHVARWLLEAPHSPYAKPKTDHPARTLLGCIVAGDQKKYIWAQAEAIAYVGWLKKFAVAFLSKEEPSATEAAADDR